MSPYFARHLGILLLILGNMVLAGYVLFSSTVEEWIRQWPMVLGIVIRSISVLYVTISLLILLAAILIFLDFECSGHGKTSWKNHRNWPKIHLEMTESEVIQIMGPPQWRSPWSETEERFQYQLHPWDYTKGGIVSFPLDPNQPVLEERKVIWLYPGDQEKLHWQFGTLPWQATQIASSFWNDFSSMLMVFSFLGLVILAIASLISIPPESYYSLGLYTPVIAFVFYFLYERNIQGGWRFDGCLLFPMYLLILGSWIAKFVVLLRSG